VPLKIEGSYDLSSQSYEKAIELYPENPELSLRLARLEIANNDVDAARQRLAQALQKKGNYTAALFLLSQIEYSEGNIKEAIVGAEQTALLAPNDIGVLFQLGFLRYLSRDYNGSILALDRAVQLNSDYSNAKYFLGLSYSMIGESKKAVSEFKDIERLNPENQEIKTILKNLNNGVAPLKGIGAPANNVEDRPDLPVDESSSVEAE